MSRRLPRVANALADWIPLVDASGPFLTLPVLTRAFPNGFDRVPAEARAAMRQRLDALDPDGAEPRSARARAAGEARAIARNAERAAWLRWVLRDLLEYGALLREGPAVPEELQHTVPEQRVTIRPDFALVGPPEAGAPTGRARLLVESYPLGTDFAKRLPDQRWTATPVERMAILCRATGVELGLVTDTNAFTLVWAPRGGSVATATWRASLWSEERGLFDAFVSLLGARRFFAMAADASLEALFAQSASAQVEVTDQLGKQVRQAVELLVDAFSGANGDSGGQLLEDLGAGDEETAAETVYAAAVTVMMRLVFMLCAEERRLFPVGDALYGGSYAVSTMLDAIREEASLHGEETLERRTAAWHRLLATFRLVHAGVQHETLRVPAYGGSLFDPERFPFLEGRRPGAAGAGTPPAVSDRSVLAILDALQFLRLKGESRRVSYHALDVEQIGHVYEGLLDHGCRLVDEIVLGLGGKEEPELPLKAFENAAGKGRDALVAFVQETTGRTGAAGIVRDLERPMDAETRRFLLETCENDGAVARRVAPFVHLLRRDLRGLPVVFLPGAFCVTQTSSRRDSGTEYTTRDLADEVVRYTLEPLVYSPGPQDGGPPDQWKLRSSAEILALRVCDPAVGSGAILVAACRYLAARLAEAWAAEGDLPADGVGDPEASTIAARRAVVDHCLYGVDRNPMAAEMAKLSLWLVTMAKDRPFSFLDHAVQSGDSLLGLTSMEQLTTFHIDVARGRNMNPDLFGYRASVEALAQQAVDKYRAMADIKVVTVRDAEEKARLHGEATMLLAGLRVLADAVAGAALRTAPDGSAAVEARLRAVAGPAAEVAGQEPGAPAGAAHRQLRDAAAADLSAGAGADRQERRPFHWPLAFPEVFLGRGAGAGFDAFVGNPPFLGGTKISGPFGPNYRDFLATHIARRSTGRADLVVYFYLRADELVAPAGTVGFLSTNTVSQGDSREVGLDTLVERGWTIYRAVKSRPWPGSATLEIAQLWLRRGWKGGTVLDGRPAAGITTELSAKSRVSGQPYRLAANKDLSFEGVKPYAQGFVLEEQEAQELLARSARNRDVIFPYLNGEDLNNSPTSAASRWIINFFDWPLERARAYRDCMQIVETRVRPEREEKDEEKYPQLVREWWKYWRQRKELYAAIEGKERAIVIARVSKTIMPAFVPTATVFSEAVDVIAFDDDFHLGVMSSVFHWWWTVTRGSTMRTDVRYTPTDCFETFPFPTPNEEVAEVARLLVAERARSMEARAVGLTGIYNLLHAPGAADPDVRALRDLHARLDHAVARAFGWGDIALDHAVRETSMGPRFTVSAEAQVELLDRLLELNHARYAEEARLGLHEPRGRRTGGKPARPARVTSMVQGSLLDDFDSPPPATARKRR